MPLISIIVPIYNVSAYITQCVESLIKQSYSNIEIILVNDGSTDDSEDICRKYAASDGRIVYLQKQNGGLSDARNFGLKHAVGDYVMFVDGDDWLDTNTCESLAGILMDQEVDLIVYSYSREYEQRSIPKRLDVPEGYYDAAQVKSTLQRRIVGLIGEELRYPQNVDALSTVCTKLYRREKIAGVEFVDTKIIGTEDALFNLYALENMTSAYCIDQAFYKYRKVVSGSLTQNYKDWLYTRWRVLFQMMRKFITERKLPQEFELALNNRICLSMIGIGICELNPNNPKSYPKKLSFLNSVLSDPLYREAFETLEMKYFPAHWLLFFRLCKLRKVWGVYMLLYLMRKLRGFSK